MQGLSTVCYPERTLTFINIRSCLPFFLISYSPYSLWLCLQTAAFLWIFSDFNMLLWRCWHLKVQGVPDAETWHRHRGDNAVSCLNCPFFLANLWVVLLAIERCVQSDLDFVTNSTRSPMSALHSFTSLPVMPHRCAQIHRLLQLNATVTSSTGTSRAVPCRILGRGSSVGHTLLCVCLISEFIPLLNPT